MALDAPLTATPSMWVAGFSELEVTVTIADQPPIADSEIAEEDSSAVEPIDADSNASERSVEPTGIELDEVSSSLNSSAADGIAMPTMAGVVVTTLPMAVEETIAAPLEAETQVEAGTAAIVHIAPDILPSMEEAAAIEIISDAVKPRPAVLPGGKTT